MSNGNIRLTRITTGKSGDFVKWETAGQKTDGILMDKKRSTGKFGEKTDLIFAGIDNESPDFTVSASPALLREAAELMECGQRYVIEYLGTRQVKAGLMKDFAVSLVEDVQPDAPSGDQADDVEESPFTEAVR